MKIFKILLIILVVGLVLFSISAIAIGGAKKMFESEPKTQLVIEEENEVTSLSIDVLADDATFVPSTNGKLKIEYYDFEQPLYGYSFSNGVATLKRVTNWKNWFINTFNFFNFTKYPMTIYYPETISESLKINLMSGNVDATEIKPTVKNFNVGVSSGIVKVSTVSTESANLSVSSGNLYVNNLTATTTKTHLSSGLIQMKDCNLGGLEIKVSSGNLSLTNVEATSSTTEMSSGLIEFSNANLGATNIVVSSGNLAGSLDFSSLGIKLSSGVIDLALSGKSTDFTVNANVSSGRVVLADKNQNELASTGNELIYGGGEKQVTVKVSSGIVTLQFTE